MTPRASVAVVGAGPAGAFCAERLARAGFAVTIFDPSHPREKPCGGGVTPVTFEKYPERVWGHELKKLYLHDNGHIVMYHLPSRQFIRLNSLNMSWVPDALVERLLTHARRRVRPHAPPDGEQHLRELLIEDLHAMPISERRRRHDLKEKLPVTERLLAKLRGLRRQDGNNYPLY